MLDEEFVAKENKILSNVKMTWKQPINRPWAITRLSSVNDLGTRWYFPRNKTGLLVSDELTGLFSSLDKID